MIRNVRSSQSHLKRGDLSLDKENIDMPAAYKTPGRLGKSDRTALLKATFQTPAAKAPLSSTKAPHTNTSHPLSVKTPHQPSNLKSQKSPLKTALRFGLRDITHQTPFQPKAPTKSNTNITIIPSTPEDALPKSSTKPKSRRASAKKASTKGALKAPVAEYQQSEEVQVQLREAEQGGEEVDVVEDVEYMPPSTFEFNTFTPDYDFTLDDLKALAEPQLETYIDASTWEAVTRDESADLPEFVPDLMCGVACVDLGLEFQFGDDDLPTLSAVVTPLFDDFVLA
ncbi:hypothetical protein HDV00_010449 [Rhizophlyctis rosea]|nr:hypothetical protein HDV00_010449 [Rhizophlyctis rosea]